MGFKERCMLTFLRELLVIVVHDLVISVVVLLAALCADPDRHFILITGVLSEEWNNVEGQTMAFVGAQPAWALLGAGSQNNMIVHLNGHAILRSDMELIIDYCKQVMYGILAERDLSVMKTNVFMEEQNASRLLKQMMDK